MTESINKNKYIIFAAVSTLILLTFSLKIWMIGTGAVLFAFFLLLYGQKYFYQFFVIAFLVLTSDISEDLRIAVNVLGIVLMGYMFFKNYGLDFSLYPKIPDMMKYFILYTLFSLVITSLFSIQILTSLSELFRFILFLILIYILYSAIKGYNDVKRFAYSLIISGVFIALIIVFAFISSGKGIIAFEVEGLVHEGAFFKNVAAPAGLFTLTIPINLAFLFSDKFRKKGKYLLWSSLFVQIIALLLTNSRAAFLGAFVSSVIILAILNRNLLKKIFISFLIFALSLILLFPKIIEITTTFIRAGRVFENTRYYIWDIAFGIIKDHPLFGCGPGMFKYYIYKYLPVMIGSWGESEISFLFDNASTAQHNFFLYRTSELGLTGFVGVAALLAVYFVMSKKVLQKVSTDKEKYILIISFISAFIGLFCRSFFESTGILTNGWITRDLPFWILFSIIIFFYQKLIIEKKKSVDL